MNNDKPAEYPSLEPESLESSDGYIAVQSGSQPQSEAGRHRIRNYALIGLAVIVLIGLVIAGTVLLTKKPAPVTKPTVTPITINTQSLDNGVLTKLINQAAPNEAKPQLTVAPDALFKKSVEVNGSFTANNTVTIGSNINVGGNQNIKGTSTLQGAVGINSNLAVRGALSVGGALSAGSLNVGSLVVTTVNASGNLNFGGHLVPSGATPAAVASVGAGGGSLVISGNDTAGTVVITTGGGAQIAGEMAIITFRAAFAGSPKVQLTPLNESAAGLRYYATRSAGFFTINSASSPAAGGTYSFDYFVTE